MSLTFSKMFPLGEKAPDFNLLNVVNQKSMSLSEAKGEKATVVMFMCNHCPYVKHIKEKMSEVAAEYSKQGVGFVAISSNDVENFPEDSPEKMKEDVQTYGYVFPYLYDETQQVAKKYMAACTPDFYVFDKQLKCVYRGRFDQTNHKNGLEPTGEDLVAALDALLKNKEITKVQHPSSGCNIKWKSGVSPF